MTGTQAGPRHDVKAQVGDEALVQRRRAQIVAAAVDLFARQGFYRTTIQEIAKKAGVSCGLIYQYVADKEDVLLLVLLSVIESYKQEIPAALAGIDDPLLRFEAAIRAYCRVIDQRSAATLLAYRSTKSLSQPRRELIKAAECETNDMIAKTVQDCIDAGLMRPVRVDLVTYQLVSFAHAWALKHWRLSELCSLEDYIDQGLDLFARALLNEAGLARRAAIRGG